MGASTLKQAKALLSRTERVQRDDVSPNPSEILLRFYWEQQETKRIGMEDTKAFAIHLKTAVLEAGEVRGEEAFEEMVEP